MPNITSGSDSGSNFFSNIGTAAKAAGSAISDFGNASADLYGAQGALASESAYVTASDLSTQNEQIARTATSIQETQQQRELFQTIGQQKADVGGAGFAESGSALDLLKSSASQGALAKSLIEAQGAITRTSYLEQSDLYAGMAQAAGNSAQAQQSAAGASSTAGWISTAAAVAAFFL